MRTQKQIAHRMPPALIERIDQQRGNLSRTYWMNLVISRALADGYFDFSSSDEHSRTIKKPKREDFSGKPVPLRPMEASR